MEKAADQRKHHAERLRPVRQRGVLQVVRAGPHIDEVERPEVDHRQAVGVDRAAGLLRHEVVHHAEESGGEEESHRVVAVPPLRHRVLGAGKQAVGLHREQVDRHRQVVEGMQQRGRQDEGQVEPVGDVDVRLLAAHDGADEQDQVGHPHHLDQDVDRPFHFGIFARLGIAQHVAEVGQHDDRHPAPEGKAGHAVRNQAGLAGALDDVIGGGKQRRAAESEYHRGGVNRTESSEREVWAVKVQERPGQLGSDIYTNRHADDRPDQRHDGKLFNDIKVVLLCTGICSDRHRPLLLYPK